MLLGGKIGDALDSQVDLNGSILRDPHEVGITGASGHVFARLSVYFAACVIHATTEGDALTYSLREPHSTHRSEGVIGRYQHPEHAAESLTPAR